MSEKNQCFESAGVCMDAVLSVSSSSWSLPEIIVGIGYWAWIALLTLTL